MGTGRTLSPVEPMCAALQSDCPLLTLGLIVPGEVANGLSTRKLFQSGNREKSTKGRPAPAHPTPQIRHDIGVVKLPESASVGRGPLRKGRAAELPLKPSEAVCGGFACDCPPEEASHSIGTPLTNSMSRSRFSKRQLFCRWGTRARYSVLPLRHRTLGRHHCLIGP
jgi:hypothetical protein